MKCNICKNKDTDSCNLCAFYNGYNADNTNNEVKMPDLTPDYWL